MSTTHKNHTKPATRRHDAVDRLMSAIVSMTEDEKNSLHPSYLRLIEAATKLRGIHGEAALTNVMHSTDRQKVNNWQRRGVSKDGALDAERYIGCPAVWILGGTIPPCDDWQRLQHGVQEKAVPYERQELRELRELALRMDTDSIRALLLLMKKL